MRVEERQPAGVVRIDEHRQHLAAEQTRQHVDVHEEVGAGGDPSRAVEREPSAGHDHMHVRMMGEGRAPRVQHRGDRRSARQGAWDRRRWRALSRPPPSSGGRRPRACSGRRCRAACSAACRRRESTGRATAPLRGRPAIGVTPQPGTSGNAGCGRNCTRSGYGGTPRSRSARHGRRAPPCGSARSRSSPSTDRGSHGRGWPRAKRDRGRGGCPRPPELVEPIDGYCAAGASLCRLGGLRRGALRRSSGLSILAMSPVATRV